MGLNAFVAFTLVGTFGLTWPEAMGVIVIEGLVIAALVLTGFREAVCRHSPGVGTSPELFLGFGAGRTA